MKKINIFSVVLTALVSIILMSFVFKSGVVELKINGTWTLDTMQEDFDNLKSICPRTIKVLANEKAVLIEHNSDQRELNSEKYLLNSDPAEIKPLTPGYKKIGFLKLIQKGNGFEISTKYLVEKDEKGNPWSYRRTETYTVSADGSTLIFLDSVAGPKGKEIFKGIYNRKP